MRQGSCTICQEMVEVRRATRAELELAATDLGCSSAESLVAEFGETFEYVCEDHDFFGRVCPGSGETPQGITEDLG